MLYIKNECFSKTSRVIGSIRRKMEMRVWANLMNFGVLAHYGTQVNSDVLGPYYY
jgi:hypothetical protein